MRHNGHIKNTFVENFMLRVNESLGTFMTWATNQSRRRVSLCTHTPTEYVAGKTDAKAIGQIHHVWREGQKELFDFCQKISTH